MKLHIYHNNAYDTVALVKDGKIISRWDATAPGSDVHKTAFEEALHTDDVSDWDDQGLSIDLDEFEESNELFLVIYADGPWAVEDVDLFVERLMFHFGDNHPIPKAFITGRDY